MSSSVSLKCQEMPLGMGYRASVRNAKIGRPDASAHLQEPQMLSQMQALEAELHWLGFE